ncbi:MAG: sugar ABC transporter substrate-binding protein [Gemmatimonadaceae bacterium]
MSARRAARALAAAALMGGAAAGGCAGADAGTVTTIDFWGLGREGEVVAQLVPDFERLNPGVRVRVQQIPWTAAHEKLLTAFVGDATPDVAQIGNTWIPEFAVLNALAPLDARVATSSSVDRDDYFDGIWDTNVIADTTFGIPWYVDTRVLFYRSDLLDSVGYATPPATWAEWRDVMERLRERMSPRQYPALLPINEWPQPVALGLQRGSPLLEDGGRRGAFSDSAFSDAFTFYIGLYRDGLASSISNTEISNRYQEFARGNLAMMITGPWEMGEFSRRLPAELQDDWMTAPLPAPDSTTPGVSLAGGASLVVFRRSAHQDAAWRFVEYLSEPARQVRFYELTGDLPPRRSAWRDSTLAGNRYARAFRTQLERVRPTPKVPEWEQIATAIAEAVEQAARGGRPVPQVLASLDRTVDGILEKRRWLLDRGAIAPATASPLIGAPRDTVARDPASRDTAVRR